MNKKAIVIVLDSVGIGELPDAANYGDKGADTLGHIINTCHPKLPHLMELGLANIDGASFPGRGDAPKGCFGKLREVSAGKDTTTGHWEIAGVQLAQAFPTFPNGFPQELLDKLADKGVKEAYITLHVGLGTFRPVKAEEISEHHMHSEFCMISKETADIINETKRAGGRIVCVGTTSCRTLESLADENGYFHEASAWTDIFIYPGYKFKAMNALITNFHLPESTLVMLVSAFADREKILNAYNIAVQERYRFFSFGDAMFIS